MLFAQNKKMRKSITALVYNFGLPAIKTCPMADICKKGCYAKQGAYIWPIVKEAYQRRYEASLKADFTKVIQEELERLKDKARRLGKPLAIRIHDSGDFYSKDYLNHWLIIIKNNPHITFYAYTKMISLFKSYSTLPSNFIIIFSYGGLEDHLIDSLIDRHSKVFESKEDLLINSYIDVAEDDLLALGDLKKVGLVYHGHAKHAYTA